jgi:hypothetical protein
MKLLSVTVLSLLSFGTQVFSAPTGSLVPTVHNALTDLSGTVKTDLESMGTIIFTSISRRVAELIIT